MRKLQLLWCWHSLHLVRWPGRQCSALMVRACLLSASAMAGAGLVWHVEQPAAAGTGSATVGLLQGGAEEVVHHRQPARCAASASAATGVEAGGSGHHSLSTWCMW
jgi:hypothetical protein